MFSREEQMKLIVGRVFWFNEYWGDTLPNSEFINNTEDTIETILSYCNLIKNNKKVVEHNFEANPTEVRLMVNEIIDLICGDMHIIRTDEEVKKLSEENGKEHRYHRHTTDNNLLYIEDEPKRVANTLIYDLKELKEIIASDKKVCNLKDFEGKWYKFDNVEEGTECIYISELKFKNDKYVFTGGLVEFTTENTHGDGVLIHDVEEMDFEDLMGADACETAEDLKETLFDETSLEEIISDIRSAITDYWFSDKQFFYDIRKRKEKSKDSDENE